MVQNNSIEKDILFNKWHWGKMYIHISKSASSAKPHMVSRNLNLNVKCKAIHIFRRKYKRKSLDLLFGRENLNMISDALSRKFKFKMLDFINIKIFSSLLKIL